MGHPKAGQPLLDEPIQIALPATTLIALEGHGGLMVESTEGRAHFLADLEVPLADARSNPSPKVTGIDCKGADSCLDHPCPKSPPARVCDGDSLTCLIREQHRKAIRDQHRKDTSGLARHRRIPWRRYFGRGCRAVGIDDLDAVLLGEPKRLVR